MCMPAAKGLFHKAIIMSGTILNVNTKAMTEELGRAVVEQLGIGPDELDKLADVPYGEWTNWTMCLMENWLRPGKGPWPRASAPGPPGRR